MKDLFAGIVTSKTRIKLLVKFFLNPEAQSYLRELSNEFDLSTNSVRKELNQLTGSNLLTSKKYGRQVLYTANKNHPLFDELISIARKTMGVDKMIDGIVNRIGDIERAYLTGDYAKGNDTGIIDLLLVGNIDHYHLNDLTTKTERYLKRKIRTLVLNNSEFDALSEELKKKPHLLIWERSDRQQSPIKSMRI